MKIETNNDTYISNKLITWYQTNRRELPWRETTNPYIIWISEIILQQTRVAQGLDYFNRFVARFPNVQALAEASEDEVLKYWQGLGYYSRARNLHAAAKTIMQQFGGKFPTDYSDVKSLKGIGDYTAAAIVSFAWNKPYAVVDGNVYRVLSRLFAIETPIDTTQGKKVFAELASSLLSHQQAGLHNQAIMELGALQCVPQNPDCTVCPLADICMAYLQQNVSDYPKKQGKIKTRNRYFHYLYIIYKKQTTWIQKRQDDDIWKGLYQFPLIETEQPCEWEALSQLEEWKKVFQGCGKITVQTMSPVRKHVLSHQTLYATFYQIEVENTGDLSSNYQQIAREELDSYAVPILIHKYLISLDL